MRISPYSISTTAAPGCSSQGLLVTVNPLRPQPDSADGFFARMHRRLTTHPDCEVWIASFGQIGPELTGALSAPGPLRMTVASKLAAKSASIPAADFDNLIARLHDRVVHPPNPFFARKSIAHWRRRSLAHMEKTALELLLFWILMRQSDSGRLLELHFSNRLNELVPTSQPCAIIRRSGMSRSAPCTTGNCLKRNATHCAHPTGWVHKRPGSTSSLTRTRFGRVA